MSGPNEWNRKVIEIFLANDGKVEEHYPNTTILLLHTLGAKSGKPRINPLVCLPDGDRTVIVASKQGRPTNPDWYYNILANPKVSVELGSEKFDALATVSDEPERTVLFAKMVARYPNYAEYQQKTERVFPVISLSRLR